MDFKKNPKKPFEVKVPNKIRKRIAMHEKDDIGLSAVERMLMPAIVTVNLKKRGSMWSRFTAGVRNVFGSKNCGGRK